MNDGKESCRYQCVYANMRLDTRDDTLCISAQVQGGNISSECTSKVGISTLKYRDSRFPLVFFVYDE